MKFFLAIALFVAVASAGVLKPHVNEDMAYLEEILAAIQSPSVDPATAAMLEEQLSSMIGINPSPAIIVEPVVEPVQVVDEAEDIGAIIPGPAIIEPIVDPVQVVDEPEFVVPGPAVLPTPVAQDNSGPLVQIIVNVVAAAPGGVSPVAVVGPNPPEAVVDPVQVVDEAEIVSPIVPIPIVLPPIIPGPIVLPPPIITPVVPKPVIVNPPKPEPVIVVNPPQPEPVLIGEPTLPIIPPSPVVLPEPLN